MRLTGSHAYYTRLTPIPKLPLGLTELIEDLTKEVLKNNPNDIYEFCANHMKKILEIRDCYCNPSKKSLTLEQKIFKAQNIIKRRAEERRHKYDEESSLQINRTGQQDYSTSTEIENQSLLQNVKSPEKNVAEYLEIEISQSEDVLNSTGIKDELRLESKENLFDITKIQEVVGKTVNYDKNAEINRDELRSKSENKDVNVEFTDTIEKENEVVTVSEEQSRTYANESKNVTDISVPSEHQDNNDNRDDIFSNTQRNETEVYEEKINNSTNDLTSIDKTYDNNKKGSDNEQKGTINVEIIPLKYIENHDLDNNEKNNNVITESIKNNNVDDNKIKTLNDRNGLDTKSKSDEDEKSDKAYTMINDKISNDIHAKENIKDDSFHKSSVDEDTSVNDFTEFIDNKIKNDAMKTINNKTYEDPHLELSTKANNCEFTTSDISTEVVITDSELSDNKISHENNSVILSKFETDKIHTEELAKEVQDKVNSIDFEVKMSPILNIQGFDDNKIISLNECDKRIVETKPTTTQILEITDENRSAVDIVDKQSKSEENPTNESIKNAVDSEVQNVNNTTEIKSLLKENDLTLSDNKTNLNEPVEVLGNHQPVPNENDDRIADHLRLKQAILVEENLNQDKVIYLNDIQHKSKINQIEQNVLKSSKTISETEDKNSFVMIESFIVDNDNIAKKKVNSGDDFINVLNNDTVIKTQTHLEVIPTNINNPNIMDLETAAITIQKVFRSFLFKSRASTLDDVSNDDNNLLDEDIDNEKKDENEILIVNSDLNKERRALGISRMDTVLQTVNEEKSLSLSTDDSSTLSSAATIIQKHVRGFLVRNKLYSNKTSTTNSFFSPRTTSLDVETNQLKNKTVLNIHIVPEGDSFLSRDESTTMSTDLPLDGSPPSSINLHPLGYDKSEPRKQLKREDAVQSISPPSNNSGKLSEDVDSVKEIVTSENDNSSEREETNNNSLIKKEPHTIDNLENHKMTQRAEVDNVIEIQKNTFGLSSSTKQNALKDIKEDENFKNINSDEMDVVISSQNNSVKETNNESKLLHSGEFHDIVLPTKVSRGQSSVVRGE